MARDRSRAARRRAEREAANRAARERAVEAAAEAADANRPRFARHADELDRLRLNGMISEGAAKAGHQFAKDFMHAGSHGQRLIIDYGNLGVPRPPRRPGGTAPSTPSKERARERFEDACACAGPLAPILVHTCICDLAPSLWMSNGTHRNGDALALLRFALVTLEAHYGRR
jgi:hypothetical protein